VSEAGELRIRAMAESDLGRVMEIAASLREAPQWPRAAYAAAIAPGAVPKRIALVAEVEGAVAGFVVGLVVASQAELESIAVDRAVQRRGIGAALLRGLIQEAALAGAEEVLLEVRASNRRAMELYGKAGFAEVGRRPGYYLDPMEDAVLMRLAIGK
jgi:ribosomal-protein-alanine N-acetyltransferase